MLVLKLLRFIFQAPLLLICVHGRGKRPRRQKKSEQAPLQNKGAHRKTLLLDTKKADKDEGLQRRIGCGTTLRRFGFVSTNRSECGILHSKGKVNQSLI